MTSLQFGKDLLPAPTRVVSIPKEKIRVIDTDPHNKKEKGLVSVPALHGEIMWAHPDIIESQEWTTVTNRKSKGKAKASSCNMVCASLREVKMDVTSLTDSEEEKIILAVEHDAPPVAGT